ncbi:MAG: staygreen family protein [bacterium]|nr:staygreen family protein [bacterium]
MKQLDPARVFTEFRNNVSPVNPVRGRKYTVTHSDDTGELFVTVGTEYADDMIGPLRDEVLLEYVVVDNKLQLRGTVLVDGENISGNSKMRNEIFLREMPTALQAVRYGDRRLFERFRELDNIPVYIWLKSENDEFNKLYDFGTMKDYI